MTRQAPHRASGPRAAGVAVILGLALITPREAHAYVDPISGSLLIQVVVAGALATVFGVRRFFGGILDHVRQWFGPRKG